MVEDVVRLCPELSLHPLRNGEVLEDREVHLVVARTGELVTAQRANASVHAGCIGRRCLHYRIEERLVARIGSTGDPRTAYLLEGDEVGTYINCPAGQIEVNRCTAGKGHDGVCLPSANH